MRGTKFAALLAASALLFVGAPRASDTPGAKFGGPFRVDTANDSIQRTPAIASDALGNTVVAWQDGTVDPNAILIRAYSALGDPFSPPVNIGAGSDPAVAASSGAPFVVLYNRGGVPRFSLFDQNGLVKEAAIAGGSTPRPTVAMDANGNFVTALFKTVNSSPAVVAQRYDATGTRIGNDILVTASGSDCQAPVVAMSAKGRFVVSCVLNQGANRGVHAIVYNESGQPLTGFAEVSGQSGPNIANVHAAMDAFGNFVLAWSFDSSHIMARFFNLNGAPSGAEFQVATDPAGLTLGGASMSAEGAAVIAWDTRAAGNLNTTGTDVFEQRFSTSHVALETQQVNPATRPHPHQFAPAVALDADGDFVVVWQDGDVGSTETHILGQRFVGPENVDIALNMSDSPDPVDGGAPVNYSFTISNLHPDTHPLPHAPSGPPEGVDRINAAIGSAHHVVVTATLPAGSGPLTQTGTDWDTCQFDATTRALQCAYDGVLFPGQSTTLIARRNAPVAGSTTSATGRADAYQFDAAPTNNVDTENTGISGNPPTVQFATATSTVAEGPADKEFRVHVTLSRAIPEPVTVTFTIGAASTATSGSDYTLTTTSPLTIPANATGADIVFTIKDDSAQEPDETIVVQLGTTSANATLGTPSTHTATITDNEVAAPPTVQFHAASESAPEDTAGAVPIQVDLSAPTAQDVVVTFTVAGTATQGTDYTIVPNNGTLTIPHGQTHATITVTVKPDTVDEFDETVVLTLTAATNATLGTGVHNTLTIIDDDAAANVPAVQFGTPSQTVSEGSADVVVPVQLSSTTTQPVTVQFSATGSASNGSDYAITVPAGNTVTIPAGAQSANITIHLPEDNVAESAETLVLTLSNPSNATLGTQTTFTLTILDNDTPGTGGNSVTLESAAQGRNVTFTTSQGRFTALSVVNAPFNPPGGLDYPLGFFAYVISDVTPNTVLTLTVDVPAGSNISDWIDCVENSCYRYPKDSSPDPGQASISGDRIIVKIQDQGAGDNDTRPGFVSSKVAPAKVHEDSGGALTWLLLAPLFGAAIGRRRPSIRFATRGERNG